MNFLNSLLFCVIVALQFLTQSKASMFISLPDPRRRPNGCYEPKLGHLIDGEMKPLRDQCGQASCEGLEGVVRYMGCPKMSPLKRRRGCRETRDLSIPYPGCCAQKYLCDPW